MIRRAFFRRNRGTRGRALFVLLSFLVALTSGKGYARDGETASDKSKWFAEARALYDAQEYAEAAALYERLLEPGYRDFTLEYNLGNAYFKSGELGKSILHYERARKIRPTDPDLLHNLDLANLRQQDKKIDPLPEHFFHRLWSGFTGMFSQTQWAGIAIAAAWSILLGLGLIWLSRVMAIRRGGLALVLLSILLLGFSLAGGYGKKRRDKMERYAVIMDPSAVLKSAPNASSTDLYILREGFRLTITGESSGWFQVTLPDGNVCWVERDAVQEV